MADPKFQVGDRVLINRKWPGTVTKLVMTFDNYLHLYEVNISDHEFLLRYFEDELMPIEIPGEMVKLEFTQEELKLLLIGLRIAINCGTSLSKKQTNILESMYEKVMNAT